MKDYKFACERCDYKSNSAELLKRHKSKAHDIRGKPGRPTLPDDIKKPRTKINADYLARRREREAAKQSPLSTAASVSFENSSVPSASPKKKIVPFTQCEPSGVISFLHWMPAELGDDEAVEAMETDHFWLQCIKHNIDPLWVYRYLRWRLGHPTRQTWRLLHGDLPGPSRVIGIVLATARRELHDEGPEFLEE